MYKKLIKPGTDIFLALMMFLCLFPVFALISAILYISLKGTPFFMQERNGYEGSVFRVIKFRTMTDEKDKYGKLLPNAKRLTFIGRILRRSSLDEIPQLINIIKGNMSFIGPRPLPVRYYSFFNDEEQKRFSVLPGISGLAQVSGRNNLMWDERLAKDIEYVDNLDLKMDLRVLFLTFKKVVNRDDIAVDPTEIMIDFDVYKNSMGRDEKT